MNKATLQAALVTLASAQIHAAGLLNALPHDLPGDLYFFQDQDASTLRVTVVDASAYHRWSEALRAHGFACYGSTLMWFPSPTRVFEFAREDAPLGVVVVAPLAEVGMPTGAYAAHPAGDTDWLWWEEPIRGS